MSMIGFLLRQEAVIRPWIRCANGEDIFGEAETRKCRLQRGRNLEDNYFKKAAGSMDQVIARAKMFCTGEPIPERSIVTVDGTEYTVIECYRAIGFGEDHIEVTLE